MGDWPEYRTLLPEGGGFLSTTTSLVALSANTPASTAWPAANLAIFVPFRVSRPVTVYKMGVGMGSLTGGNFDVGIYDRFGNKMVSSGATARPGASQERIIDITDTVIGPGLYYFGMSADGTNNYIMITPSGTSPVPLQKSRSYGCLQMATAYTLPDPVTFAALSTSPSIPVIAAYLRPY